MGRVTCLVLVSLLTMSSAALAQDNLTTIEDYWIQRTGTDLRNATSSLLEYYSNRELTKLFNVLRSETFSSHVLPLDWKDASQIFKYVHYLKNFTLLSFTSDLGRVTAESIYEDLRGHCPHNPEMPMKDLRAAFGSKCEKLRFHRGLTSRFLRAVEDQVHAVTRLCTMRQNLRLCSAKNRECSAAFEDRVRHLLRTYNDDVVMTNIDPTMNFSPLFMVNVYILYAIEMMSQPLYDSVFVLQYFGDRLKAFESIEPFAMGNLLYPISNTVISKLFYRIEATKSEDESTWGIVRSDTGAFNFTCSKYRQVYSKNRTEFDQYFKMCHKLRRAKSFADFLGCVYGGDKMALAWSSVPAVFVRSQCLCVASNGHHCGVDHRAPCLAALLEDFRRQISYRPAITYLDYAFQTRVPLCKFTYLLALSFSDICNAGWEEHLDTIMAAGCYFRGLFNKDLNCTESPTVMDTSNETELCAAKYLFQYVLCPDGADVPDDEITFPYYSVGDSPLVLALTYFDVAMRLVTIVTYVACPQLRNLPGKLLVAYQLTALSRLLLVRALLEDLAVAVRLDVAMDLASTLWLTAYLHLVTVSIRDLRLPNSLSTSEALVVLFRSALLGWILPAALSAAFFYADDFLDSYVQVGQLLFLVCNYLALFGNLFMFYINFKTYYEVRSNASDLQKHVKSSKVFTDLFSFAVKTSVLSGAGIIFRLVFTQIQGLQQVLGYYHVLSTLHGLLLFLLFGCNREARDFWVDTFRRCRTQLAHVLFRTTTLPPQSTEASGRRPARPNRVN